LVLHVGPLKTGTTYLQSQLFTNRTVLEQQGFHLPGLVPGDHHFAVLDRIGLSQGFEVAKRWDALVSEVRASDGTAIVTAERLACLTAKRAEQVVSGFGDIPVSVVVTLRDLNRTTMSLWQESLQNRNTWSWPDYLEAIRAFQPDAAGVVPEGAPLPAKRFWAQWNLPRILRVWRNVATDGLSLVILPPPGAPRETLRDRFAAAVGYDPTGMGEPPVSNPSLTAPASEVALRLNRAAANLGKGQRWARRVRKAEFTRRALADSTADFPRVGAAAEEWCSEATERLLKRWRMADDVRRFGEWEDLTPVAVRGVASSEVTEDEVLEAGRRGYLALDERMRLRHPDATADLVTAPWPEDVDRGIDALIELIATFDRLDQASA